MGKHKLPGNPQISAETDETIPEGTIIVKSEHIHDIHESSDNDNIYRSCRTCPFSETIPRK